MPAPDPRKDAERAYQQALRDRAKALEPAVAEALAAMPGGWACFHLLRQTEAFRATRQQDRRRASLAASSPEIDRALRCVRFPCWKSVLRLEALCGRQYGLLDPFYDGPSGMADRIAAALGIEVDPPPPPPKE